MFVLSGTINFGLFLEINETGAILVKPKKIIDFGHRDSKMIKRTFALNI